MSTTQHPTQLLPENVQEAVNLAYSRMTAMKEEESTARRNKLELEKEIGRLSLEKDTANGLAEQAVAAFKRAQADLDIKNSELSEVSKKVTENNDTLTQQKNELVALKEQTEREITRREEVIADISARLEHIREKEQKIHEEKQALEERKKKLIEVIQTI